MCNRALRRKNAPAPVMALASPKRLKHPCFFCFGRRWTTHCKMVLKDNLHETEAPFFAILFVMGEGVRLLGGYGNLPL